MDKTVVGLLGAVGALVAAGQTQAAPLRAAPETVLQANSYAELLRPVPDAAATLRALDGQEGRVELAQLGPIVRDIVRPHHHHHHHHRYYRRAHHHHHHHHHNRYYR